MQTDYLRKASRLECILGKLLESRFRKFLLATADIHELVQRIH